MNFGPLIMYMCSTMDDIFFHFKFTDHFIELQLKSFKRFSFFDQLDKF